MRWLCRILAFLILIPASAQERTGIERKMSPSILQSSRLPGEGEQLFIVRASNLDSLRNSIKNSGRQEIIISEYYAAGIMILKLSRKLLDSTILPLPHVRFVDLVRTPKEESIIDGFDLSTNKINLLHNKYPGLNGEGLVVSVKENRPDTNDIDFTGRYKLTTGISANMTSHATIMATIIAGGGNSFSTGKGAAWGSGLSSSDFTNLVPNSDQFYKQYGISVQNHSYGTGIENYYGADAEAYDASTLSNPSLVHVFSAGNSGDKTSTNGIYSGKPLVANLTGSFKMAKNIIVAGSVDSFGLVSPLSSRGPAYDGRLRPEILAFGQDGSSGAAALVSGTALLLQHAYQQKNAGELPSSALVRSALLNSADDIGSPGIDFKSGFGNMNAYKAMLTVLNKNYFSGQVKNNEVKTHALNLPRGISRLKITICWNDVPANANDPRSLINDLDMRLVYQPSGQDWQPWVLSTYPNIDSLTALPTRRKDSVNNLEFISVEDPLPGVYMVEIKGYKIPIGPQSYYISYQLDTSTLFSWNYPTATDMLMGGTNTTLRWSSSFPNPTGKLYFSVDAGKQWTLLSSDIDLKKQFFNWVAPDTIANVLFRMVIADTNFDSDTSQVSERLITHVGFNCSDSFSFHWDAAPTMKSFTVYRLGKKYLEPILTTTDTAVILKKSVNPSMHYAIAANTGSKPGIRSYTFNYTTQGIACYIKNFLVDLLSSSTGSIQLELGTTYNVSELSLEKASPSGFQPIQKIQNAIAVKYEFSDPNLLKGSNTYRVRIDLADGNVIYSNPETIFYLPGISFLVYPNPAKTEFRIFSRDTDNADVMIYNSMGQKVFARKINSTLQVIQILNLKRGMHFMIIMQSGKKIYQGKLMLQ